MVLELHANTIWENTWENAEDPEFAFETGKFLSANAYQMSAQKYKQVMSLAFGEVTTLRKVENTHSRMYSGSRDSFVIMWGVDDDT